MALSTLEINTISKGIALAKRLVEEIKPALDELNVVYDRENGVKTTITDQNLNLSTGYSGLSKTELDAAMYALTATLKGDLASAYTQLTILASRG